MLTGGAGADEFVFHAVSESSAAGKAGFDQIRGSNHHVFDAVDRIDVSAVDGDALHKGHQDLKWGGQIAANAQGHAGYLYAADSKGGTLILASVDGSGGWDFKVEIEDGSRAASWYGAEHFIV